MVGPTTENSREKLVHAGVELFRRNGYVATTVDQICAEAGVSKGAFFHHFESKESLAQSCLTAWKEHFAAMHENAPFQTIADPREKLLEAIDYFSAFFSQPNVLMSCLAGTIVQEVSESNTPLRDAANSCLANGRRLFKQLLDAACRNRRPDLDTDSIAKLWIATLQGSLLVHKASRDNSVIGDNLRHFRNYVESLLKEPS